MSEKKHSHNHLHDLYATLSQDIATSHDPMTFIQKIIADLQPNLMRATKKFIKSNAPIATIGYQKNDYIWFKNIVIESFNADGIRFFSYLKDQIQQASIQFFWTHPSNGQIRMIGELMMIHSDVIHEEMKHAAEPVHAHLSGMHAYQFKPTQVQIDFIVNHHDQKPDHYVVTYKLNEDQSWTQTNDVLNHH